MINSLFIHIFYRQWNRGIFLYSLFSLFLVFFLLIFFSFTYNCRVCMQCIFGCIYCMRLHALIYVLSTPLHNVWVTVTCGHIFGRTHHLYESCIRYFIYCIYKHCTIFHLPMRHFILKYTIIKNGSKYILKYSRVSTISPSSKFWTASCNSLRTTLPLLVTLALTSFFDVLVHIITARWGVWDVVMGHKVNLERSLQHTSTE